MIRFTAEKVALPEWVVRHQNELRRWINGVAAFYGFQTGDITYLLCDDDYILQTNRAFLQHDYYTDVITFDYSTDAVLAGDIVISLETVKSNAETEGVPFGQELCRVLIHGILHLTGQGDKTPDTKEEMTRKENLALATLPVLRF